MRQKRALDPEWARAQRRENYAKQGRKYSLKWKYSLTLERWAEMLAEQDNRCYLCLDPFDLESTLPIHVDHDRGCCPGDRSCGTCIRGLAHQRCNQGIGQFKDDPKRLRLVADNLEAAQVQVEQRRINN